MFVFEWSYYKRDETSRTGYIKYKLKYQYQSRSIPYVTHTTCLSHNMGENIVNLVR